MAWGVAPASFTEARGSENRASPGLPIRTASTRRSVTATQWYLVRRAPRIPPTSQTLGPRMAMVAAWICSPGSMIEPSPAIILAFGLSLSAIGSSSSMLLGSTNRLEAGGNPTTSGRGRRSWSAGLALSLAGPQEGPALQLIQAAPDPMGLPDAQGVFQAFLTNGAANADGAGSGLAGVLLLLALEVVGGKEEAGVLAAASGSELPADHSVCNGHSGRPAGGPSLLRCSSS